MKNRNNLALSGKLLVFFYLCLFPFGQILKTNTIFNNAFSINLIDLLVLFTIFYYIKIPKRPLIDSDVKGFLSIGVFSLVLSLIRYTPSSVLIGSFYLIRFFSYYCFYVLTWHLVKEGHLSKKLLYQTLILITVFTAIYGWVQYIFIPDLTSLKYVNWDDHLYRLVGTFLDPSYTGIIFVFGLTLSLVEYRKSRNIYYLPISLFILISLAFTYSRASYLALVFALGYLFLKSLKTSRLILAVIISIFALIILLLPRLSSEGTLLERTQSIFARVSNYREAFVMIRENPLFGIGFNNLCAERLSLFGGNPGSHACSGLDSSMLFILATTGVIGFLIFTKLSLVIYNSLEETGYALAFKSCGFALFIHSFFAQSAFYSFVMGYMALLYSLAVKTKDGN